MMRLFADTFYWIALANRRDQWRGKVQAFNRTVGRHRLITTGDVLAEFLTFSGEGLPHMRRRAAQFVRRILADPEITVIPQSHGAFLEGLSLYETRLDKHYSLTDCISMQAMRREGLADILTNDRHFTQEGFRILFP